MKHSCVKFILAINSWLTAILLGVFSTPVMAANNFSFVDYNLAFILGLSLPLILISTLLSRKVDLNWQFSITTTLSLFVLLYTLGHAVKFQHILLLSNAVIFLSLINLWPFYGKNNLISRYKKHATISIIILTTCYLLLLWIFPQTNIYMLWLLVSGLILLVSLLRLIEIKRTTTKDMSRLILQWLCSCALAISIYLWLNTYMNLNLLVVIIVLTYLISIMNGSWVLIQTIYQAINNRNLADLSVLSNEELFSYTHDPVTNLPSYQHVVNQFEAQFLHEEKPNYAIIVFQPINFSQVNAILGHQNSDILLLQLAYALQQKSLEFQELLTFERTQPPIKIARLQGLKFLTILDLTQNSHPEKIVVDNLCQQLSKTVPTAMSFKSFSLNFELAFGIKLLNKFGEKLTDAIAHAEDALLKGQQQKQTITYFNNASILYTEQQLAKMELLKQAINNELLTWLVHPQISVTNKEVYAFKLIVYWKYSDENAPPSTTKMIAFSEFAKTAELSGDIYKLAKQMISKAFELLKLLQQADIYKNVAIDLSSKHLLEPELINFIEQQSLQHNISLKYLTIEFAEAIMFAENTRSQKMIDQLRTLDINISIANFSGSYQALRFLRKLIVKQIKISCEKLIDDDEYATDKVIINSLLNLATTMNIPVIGTEIDNQVIAKNFTDIGGQYIEGKVISNGLSFKEIPHWLRAW